MNPDIVVTISETFVFSLPQYGFCDVISPWRGLLVAHEADGSVIDPFDASNKVLPVSLLSNIDRFGLGEKSHFLLRYMGS